MSGGYHILEASIKRSDKGQEAVYSGVITNGVRSWSVRVTAPLQAKVDMRSVPYDDAVSSLAKSAKAIVDSRSIGISCDACGNPQSAAFYVGSIRVSPCIEIRADGEGRRDEAKSADIAASFASIPFPKEYCLYRQRKDGSRYWIFLIPDMAGTCRDIHGDRVELSGFSFVADDEHVAKTKGGPAEYLIKDTEPLTLIPRPNDRSRTTSVRVSPIELKSKVDAANRLWVETLDLRRAELAEAVRNRADTHGMVRIAGRLSNGLEPGWIRHSGADGEYWVYKLPDETMVGGVNLGRATISVPAIRESRHAEGVYCAYIKPDEELVVRMPGKGRDRRQANPLLERRVTASEVSAALKDVRAKARPATHGRRQSSRAPQTARSGEDPFRERHGGVDRQHDAR